MDLGTAKINKLFIQFVIPSIISLVISGIQTIIDGIFVGTFIGEVGLASINIAAPFVSILFGIIFIVVIGSMSYIARSLGAGNEEYAQDTFKTSFIFLGTLSILIGITGFVGNTTLAKALGAEGELIQHSGNYIKMIALFAPFHSMMFLFGFVDRVLGNPKLYLKGSVISAIVNISLNYIFLAIFEMGTTGAGIATGLAYVVAFAVVAPPLLKPTSVIGVIKGKFKYKILGPVLYNGSSEGITAASAAIATFMFNITFMEISGVEGVASFTAISYLATFGLMLIFGISDGIASIISYNFGSKNHGRVVETMKLSYLIQITISTGLFLVLTIFGEALVGLFADGNQEMIEFATSGSKIYAFALLLNGFNIITAGYFTSIGDARSSILLAISRGLIFILMGITILPKIFGVNGVWAVVPFAEAMTFLIGLYFMKNKNKLELKQGLIYS
ncbi:hypothetical protein AN639_00425 [Candidatus Epulonipiscium fishelsonii]|uniref:Uncharacterized protein n=1 Tax=Candidatus Epulonipiscium fishelsonii TaxID=77094 RepID=A0ACC8XCY4_9FIRM|nr:hypothetical protein AN396_05355 [Epulopiscium sp. SCG-B11WGA-EpuloA1]ONI41851.1 hypothetical protein AN639_00425 [Epulopiscium sp. SCG-B05WGA-EpuloA1]